MAFLNQPCCVCFKDSRAQSLQMPFQKERLILIIRRPVLFVLFLFFFPSLWWRKNKRRRRFLWQNPLVSLHTHTQTHVKPSQLWLRSLHTIANQRNKRKLKKKRGKKICVQTGRKLKSSRVSKTFIKTKWEQCRWRHTAKGWLETSYNQEEKKKGKWVYWSGYWFNTDVTLE